MTDSQTQKKYGYLEGKVSAYIEPAETEAENLSSEK